jgi:small-conductance mechanosensitive channel
VRRIVNLKIDNKELNQLIFRITRWVILILGTILALDQVNFDVTGFIAGLGVAGFTIGFALQDIAKDFISGLLLLYRQPFHLGDYVRISDFEGRVKDINVRDTVIETLDGEMVIIPNQDVFENPILNYTDAKFRRRSLSIGLGYEENADFAIDVFLDTINAVPGVEKKPEPSIRVVELGESTLNLLALYWINQEVNDFFEVHSNVVKAIKEAAEKNDINLPYPVHTVFLRKLEE